MKRVYDFSKGKRGAVVQVPPGKTRITIRLDDDLLDWFRGQVHAAGGGNYQTLINNSLREHVQHRKESLEDVLRHVIREELLTNVYSERLAEKRTAEPRASYMDYWSHVAAEAQRVYETTMTHSRDEIALLRKAISCHAKAFAIANDSAEFRAATVRKALVSHNFNTLNLSFDAALQGYYVQSIALLRNVYENWLAFWYLAKYPQEAHYWLNPSWEKRPPKAENMRNKIDHPFKEAKSKLHDSYAVLSRFDHTDPAAVLSRIEMVENEVVIRVGVRYNEGDFAACAYALSLWAGSTLDTMASIVPSDNSWHEDYAKLGDEILAFIEEYNENHASKDRA